MTIIMKNTSEAYKIHDIFAGHDLTDIQAVSDRARSLLARNYKERDCIFQDDGMLNVIGAIDMIDGMEYHFELACNDRNAFHRQHNHIAYLNRLGQFYSFLKSSFVKELGLNAEDDFPVLREKYGLRLKVSAHRSIDDPRRETQEEKLNSAIVFTVLDEPKYEGRSYTYKALVNDEVVSLCLEKDHPVIMSEAYIALEKIITSKRPS